MYFYDSLVSTHVKGMNSRRITQINLSIRNVCKRCAGLTLKVVFRGRELRKKQRAFNQTTEKKPLGDAEAVNHCIACKGLTFCSTQQYACKKKSGKAHLSDLHL